VEGIIVTFVNITKLKQAQSIVSNISNRLENAMDMGEMSWWEWDYELNIVKTGYGKYAMLGYEKNEIGDGYVAWTNLIHPDDLAKSMLSMKDHLEGKADKYFVEYRIKHKNGHYLWYRDKGGIVSRTDNGKPKLLMGIVMNITKEKLLAEQYQSEINFTQTAILNNEVKYKLLHHNMAQGVVFQTPAGEILDANPAAEKLLGLTCIQLKGRFINHPQWNAINKDKTPFPAAEHPTIRAATTKQACYNEVIGIYNPFLEKHIWIKITSIPIIHEIDRTVSQVYSLYYEIENQ
jgi:two-component system CheB/CheR fusion protein